MMMRSRTVATCLNVIKMYAVW